MFQKVRKPTESKASWEFLPYWVRVDPKWHEILSDFKLIATSDDWERVKTAVYGVLPYGFSFTVLQQSEENQLIFCPDPRGQFLSEVRFCHEICPIEFDQAPKKLRVFMEWRGDGYDVGIIVPEKWWDTVKADCPKPMEEDSREMWYEAKLTLARISRAEFSWYRQPQCGEDDGYEDRYEAWSDGVISKRDEFRAKLGWVEGTYSLAHKYFEIQHKQI